MALFLEHFTRYCIISLCSLFPCSIAPVTTVVLRGVSLAFFNCANRSITGTMEYLSGVYSHPQSNQFISTHIAILRKTK